MRQDKLDRKIHKAQKKMSRERSINRDILKIAVGISVLFIAMAVYFVYFIEFQSNSAINNTYNKRSEEYKARVVRGSIYADGGEEILAKTIVDEEGNEYRQYPYGTMFAHIVGFESNGGLGIENSYNYYMLESNIDIFTRLKNEYKNEKSPGNAIVTSLKTGLQTSINDVLSYAGNCAAFAMDPDTGEIYAVVSKPDFDPNYIAQIWDEIVNDENNSILLNRATQGQYTPGSTFKIFTLDEYLRENPEHYSDYQYDCVGEYRADDMTMHCYGYAAHGLVDLDHSLAYSCNCSFANIGVQLNRSQFIANNKRLLFDSALPLDIPYNRSSFSLDKNASEPEIIQTAIGQGNTLVTPAHMALIMSAIANNGVLMKPHIITDITNADGDVIQSFNPEIYDTLFEPGEAKVLKEYLRDVVAFGTANVMEYSNYTAYGKTGTAETVSNFNVDKEASDHSWFAGWAEQGDKKLVLCVLVEKAQDTWASAAQFSKAIFDSYFQ